MLISLHDRKGNCVQKFQHQRVKLYIEFNTESVSPLLQQGEPTDPAPALTDDTGELVSEAVLLALVVTCLETVPLGQLAPVLRPGPWLQADGGRDGAATRHAGTRRGADRVTET